MKKKHGGHGKGKISHGNAHVSSVMGKDPHAHSSHHAANKEHGMPHGFAPPDGMEEGSECCDGPANSGGEDYE